jgi:hypothetical protein
MKKLVFIIGLAFILFTGCEPFFDKSSEEREQEVQENISVKVYNDSYAFDMSIGFSEAYLDNTHEPYKTKYLVKKTELLAGYSNSITFTFNDFNLKKNHRYTAYIHDSWGSDFLVKKIIPGDQTIIVHYDGFRVEVSGANGKEGENTDFLIGNWKYDGNDIPNPDTLEENKIRIYTFTETTYNLYIKKQDFSKPKGEAFIETCEEGTYKLLYDYKEQKFLLSLEYDNISMGHRFEYDNENKTFTIIDEDIIERTYKWTPN